MALIFDERFETVGYDEAGWTEAVPGGCICNENKDTAEVSGAPDTWGAKCLEIYKDLINSVYTWKQLSADQPIAYYRLEVILSSSEGWANEESVLLLRIRDNSDASVLKLYLYQDGSSNKKFLLKSYHDGNSHDYYSFPNLVINTRYRVELKWDATNDAWAWKIDGVSQPNNIDSNDPVTSEGTLTSTHPTHCRTHHLGMIQVNNLCQLIYYDNFAIDDTTWIGAPASGDDYLKCSHTADLLVGTWTSPEYDLGSLKTVRVWGDFVILFIDSAVSWGGIFPGSTLWSDKIGANTRWYELTTPDVAAKLEAKIKWGTVSGVYPNETDFFQILAPEFTARYLQVEIKITDPQVDAHLYVAKLNMKAAYWS